jgi:hypothetical protein
VATEQSLLGQLQPRIDLQRALRDRRRAVFASERLPLLQREREIVPALLNATIDIERELNPNFLPWRGGVGSIIDILEGSLGTFNNRSQGISRSTRVYLTETDLRELGIAAGDFDPTATVTFGDVLEQLGFTSGPYRSRDLMTQVNIRRALAELDAEPRGPEEVIDADAPSSATTIEAFRQTILDRLNDQVLGLKVNPEDPNPAADLHRIKDTVRQLEMGGITEVAAMQDVQVLEIAFEPTWTAVFDRRFENDVRRLYRETAALDATYGMSLPDLGAIENLNQFREFLAELEDSAEYTELEAVDASVLEVAPWLTGALWNRLGDDPGKQSIIRIVARLYEVDDEFVDPPTRGIDDPARVAAANEQIREIVEVYRNQPLSRAEELAADIASRLNQPYKFHYFAPKTINYGLMTTYRQSWRPVTYQAGRLAHTIPLAPGEVRSFKTKVRSSRKQHHSSRRKTSMRQLRESSSVSRTEIEAMEKASLAINNQISSQGSFNIGIGQIGVTSQFGINQQQESSRLQKSFNEISRKASEESRQEVEILVEETIEDVTELESTRTLSNPNQELTVTYLLYELERRFQVETKVSSVQPVLLVALDMPAPHEITNAWILEYAYILREVVLSDDLLPAFDHLERDIRGASMELEILRATYSKLSDAAENAEAEFDRLMAEMRRRRETVVSLLQAEGVADAAEMDTGQRVAAAIFSGGFSELFGGGESDRDELIKARREAAEKALEYLETEAETAAAVRKKANEELNEAAARYTSAMREQAEQEQLIDQLKLNIRGNIHHYMHEIWSRMQPGELFFSLYDVQVPFVEPVAGTCTLRPATPEELEDEVPGLRIDGELYVVAIAPASPAPDFDELPRRRLVEIADLDRPLGFRGNYAIFPLRQNSQITDYMMIEYLDSYFGVRDPATGDGYSAVELLRYAREVWNDEVIGLDREQKDWLMERIIQASVDNPGDAIEVVLPTGQLYMEALKGDQALLESFKLAHRGLDVLAVEEQIRERRIDNLRQAQRIGEMEPQLDDPTIDKVVVIKGDADIIVPSDD